MIVDSQIHLWSREAPTNDPDRSARARLLTEAEILTAMDEAGVTRAVLVPPSWNTDNDFALAAAQRHPNRFAVMGLPPKEAAALAAWKSQPGMLGLRFTFTGKAAATVLREQALDPMWRAAEAAGLPVMLYPPGLLDEVARIARNHPGMRLVLDHMAAPINTMDDAAFAHLPELLALATLPNVAIKASALPLASSEPFPFRPVHEPLRRVVDAFGPARVFWGSDLTRLACPYHECVDVIDAALPGLTSAERALIMGGAINDWLGWAAD